jgi:hypothetical protein
MNQLKQEFNKNKILLSMGWSTWSILFYCVNKKKYPAKEIRDCFNELVDKNDYSRTNKDDLLNYLFSR